MKNMTKLAVSAFISVCSMTSSTATPIHDRDEQIKPKSSISWICSHLGKDFRQCYPPNCGICTESNAVRVMSSNPVNRKYQRMPNGTQRCQREREKSFLFLQICETCCYNETIYWKHESFASAPSWQYKRGEKGKVTLALPFQFPRGGGVQKNYILRRERERAKKI